MGVIEDNNRIVALLAKKQIPVLALRRIQTKDSIMDCILIKCSLEHLQLEDNTSIEYIKYVLGDSEYKSKLDSSEIKVLYKGKLDKFPNPENIVMQYKPRKVDIQQGKLMDYRNYLHNKDEAGNYRLLCPIRTADMSWGTAITRIGSAYGFIIKLTIKK